MKKFLLCLYVLLFSSSQGYSFDFDYECLEKLDINITEVQAKAKQGDAVSQYILGYCLYRGINISKNKPEALKWIRKAADQEYSEALATLGYFYYVGVKDYIKPDKIEAKRLLKLAEDNGCGRAGVLLLIIQLEEDKERDKRVH